MTHLTVSILTPSYNQGQFLGDCLASVANQTMQPMEHIVMDGGSTDESVAILEKASVIVKWESEKDRGQSHALNKAFARSSGDIIGWVNSDDGYADRRAIEKAVEIFEANPDVGVVYGHSLMIDQHSRVLQAMWAPDRAHTLLPLMTSFTQPSVFLRRSVLQDPFVREHLHFVMDRDLWMRLRKVTKFTKMDLLVGIDRHHGDRKVESQAYLRERDAYYGPTLQSRPRQLLRKALKSYWRMRGLSIVASIDTLLEPAFELHFDSKLTFAARQGLVPRRFMA